MKCITALDIKIIGIIALVIGIISLCGVYLIAKNYSYLLLMTMLPGQFISFSIISGTITGILSLIAGIGLLKRRKWAKNIFICVAVYTLLTKSVLLLSGLISVEKPYVIIIPFMFYGFIIFYLCRPRIKTQIR